MRESMTYKLLRNASLFAELKQSELEIIEQNSATYPYQKGQILFDPSNHQQEFYIIASGEVVITKKGTEEREVELALYRPGDSFGEFRLFEEASSHVTAKVSEAGEIIVFPRRDISFQDFLSQHPQVGAKLLYLLLRMTSNRIRETNQLLTQRTEWVETLKRQIFSDKLTGAMNKTYLEEEIGSQLMSMGEFTSFLVIKPDNFKLINDTYGHEIGDRALKLLADTYKASLRKQDQLVRYRSNEFIHILPDTDTDEATDIAQMLLQRVLTMDTSYLHSGLEIPASIGVATFPTDGENVDTLIQKGYERLWAGQKEGGKAIKAPASV